MFATVSVDRYSFPSGHTTRCFLLLPFFMHFWADAALWLVGIAVWSCAVAASRIALGV
jgi:presqualene diphosphate phosphatase